MQPPMMPDREPGEGETAVDVRVIVANVGAVDAQRVAVALADHINQLAAREVLQRHRLTEHIGYYLCSGNDDERCKGRGRVHRHRHTYWQCASGCSAFGVDRGKPCHAERLARAVLNRG